MKSKRDDGNEANDSDAGGSGGANDEVEPDLAPTPNGRGNEDVAIPRTPGTRSFNLEGDFDDLDSVEIVHLWSNVQSISTLDWSSAGDAKIIVPYIFFDDESELIYYKKLKNAISENMKYFIPVIGCDVWETNSTDILKIEFVDEFDRLKMKKLTGRETWTRLLQSYADWAAVAGRISTLFPNATDEVFFDFCPDCPGGVCADTSNEAQRFVAFITAISVIVDCKITIMLPNCPQKIKRSFGDLGTLHLLNNVYFVVKCFISPTLAYDFNRGITTTSSVLRKSDEVLLGHSVESVYEYVSKIINFDPNRYSIAISSHPLNYQLTNASVAKYRASKNPFDRPHYSNSKTEPQLPYVPSKHAKNLFSAATADDTVLVTGNTLSIREDDLASYGSFCKAKKIPRVVTLGYDYTTF